MNGSELRETLLQAIDIVAKDRLKSIRFDTTIKCTIVQNNHAKRGEYRVSNGGASFIAYSTETGYEIDDQVLVTIPNGDYDQQKIIIGRAVVDTDTSYIYVDPFSTIIDITGNLIVGDQGENWLFANGKTNGLPGSATTEGVNIPIWTQLFPTPLQGYDRLAIKAEFSAWLSSMRTVEGSYGLALAVTYAGDITNSQEPDSENREVVKWFILDSEEDFFGNIYAFDSYYPQSVVFDISNIKSYPITKMELYFYQNQDFKDNDDRYIQSPDYDLDEFEIALHNGTVTNLAQWFATSGISENIDAVSFVPNLYVKDPYVCLGYAVGNFEKDEAILYTSSTLTYDTYKSDAENTKTANLRWVHEDDKKTIAVDTEWFGEHVAENYEIRWYRYKLGAPSPDAYAGVFWTLLAEFNYSNVNTFYNDTIVTDAPFIQSIIPDTTTAQEQLKVIIVKDGTIVARSNIITFTNEYDTATVTQTDMSNALGIVCGYPDDTDGTGYFLDNQQGSFFLYKKGNDLVDDSRAQEMFSLSPTFKSLRNTENSDALVPLTEAEVVIWSFPASNTMIRPVFGDNEFITIPSSLTTTITEEVAAYFNNSCTRYLLKGPITREVTIQQINFNVYTYVIYNQTLDVIEFLHVSNRDSGFYQFTDVKNNSSSIIQHYYIQRTYMPQRVRNTVELEIVKDRIRYHTARQFYFGQSGSSGSAYTILVDFRNNMNALTINDVTDPGRTSVYTGEDNYYALMPSIRLVDTDGKDVIDFQTASTVQVTFDWLYSIVENHVQFDVPVETRDLYYPVQFNDNMGKALLHDPQDDTKNPANYFWESDEMPSDEATWNSRGYHRFIVNQERVGASLGEFVAVGWADREIRYNTYLYRKPMAEEQHKKQIEYKEITYDDNTDYLAKTARGKHFILINGYYILDPYTEFNEAQHYFSAVDAEKSVSSYDVLLASNVGPDNADLPINQAFITINPEWERLATARLTTNTLLNSLSVLRITISGFGDYDLVKYLPIPIRRYSAINWCQSVTGASEIQYHSTGEVPNYYQKQYEMTLVNLNTGTIDVDTIKLAQDSSVKNYSVTSKNFFWDLFVVGTDNNSAYIPQLTYGKLKPLPIYIPEAPAFGIQYKNTDGIAYWSQPILVYEDNYPSSTINAWDGVTITTDDSSGTILASALAAGKKDKENKFSGVMLGDWSRSDTASSVASQTGLYGFNKGQMSFAFKEDGTAFIGKDGRGRIYLAGDKAQIYSSSWLYNKTGLLFDLDKGDMELAYRSSYRKKNFNNSIDYKTWLRTHDGSTEEILYIYQDQHAILTETEYNQKKISTTVYYPAYFALQATNSMESGLRALPNTYYSLIFDNSQDEPVIDPTEYAVDAPGLYDDYISTVSVDANGITFIENTVTYIIVQISTTPTGGGEPEVRTVKKKQTKSSTKTYQIVPAGTLITSDMQNLYRPIKYAPVPTIPGQQIYQGSMYNTSDFSTFVGGYYFYIPSSETDKYKTLSYTGNHFGNIHDPTNNATILHDDDFYDPIGLYYTRRANEGPLQRYASFNAYDSTYPLTIGQQPSSGARPFRVNWDGDVFIANGDFTGMINATGGRISGDLTIYGSLTAATWTIDSNSIRNAPDVSNATTILAGYEGSITTDFIHIHAVGKHDLSGKDLYATVGYIEGSTTATENGVTVIRETDLIGMVAEGQSLLIGAKTASIGRYANIGLRCPDDIYIDSGCPVETNNTSSGSGSMVLFNNAGASEASAQAQGGIVLKGNYLEIRATNLKVTTEAGNQSGIYAFFA